MHPADQAPRSHSEAMGGGVQGVESYHQGELRLFWKKGTSRDLLSPSSPCIGEEHRGLGTVPLVGLSGQSTWLLWGW